MNLNELSAVRCAAKSAGLMAMLAGAAALSGCAYLGWGGSAKKPAELAPVSGVNPASIVWSASVGKSAGYLFVPGFSNKLVYAAGRDGSIYALSEEGGRIVTVIDAKMPLTGGVGVNDDTVVVGSGKGDVVALDSAGRSLWKSSVSGEVLAPPTVASGNVIVRTADGRIVALNRIDGKRKWVFQRAAPALTLRTNASVLVNRGVIYAGYPGGKVIALELDSGKPIWEATISLARGATELERIADVSGLPVLDDTRICAAVYQGRTGCVETLNGNVLWSREISSADGVAIDAKHVYVADIAGNVFALDKVNGATVWKLEKLQLRDPGTPIVVKGSILTGDRDGFVHVISPDKGELTGRVPTDGTRVISLSANGERVIAQTEKGGVFALAVN